MDTSDRLRRLLGARLLLAVWAPLLVLQIVVPLLGRRRSEPAHISPDHPTSPCSAAPIRKTDEAAPTVARSGIPMSPPAAR